MLNPKKGASKEALAKAALIPIEQYEALKRLQGLSPEARENGLFLANNPSFDFLKDEPDLY